MDLTSDERRALGARALDMTLAYFEEAANGPIYPRVGAEELRRRLHESLPREPQDGGRVLDDYRALVGPSGRNNGHPRMFGYVSSSASFMSVLGDLLASTSNQNVTSWRSAPGPTTIERQVVGWIAEMVGADPAGAGLLTSGGSMANFVALAAAVRRQAGVDVTRDGVRALVREPAIYMSSMGHMSIPKAAGLLGLGRSSVREVAVGDDFTIDVAALEQAIDADLSAGCQPLCVAANAGDVNTGAIDPLNDLADLCARRKLWLHVDAAYGGFAAAAPSLRDRFAGLSRADSVALDPHKWLYVPLDVGCVLTRDPAAFNAVFSHGADYMDVLDAPSDFAFWDYGPELSRRFRALKIWMTLKRHGVNALGEAIEENVRLARRLGTLIGKADDFELMAPVSLSIVCFRFVPPTLRSALAAAADAEARAVVEAELDALNQALTVEVQRGGADAYFSNATLGGRFALRACLVNYRTTEDDLTRLLDAVRAAAAAVSG